MVFVDTVEYAADQLTFEAFLAYDQDRKGKRPGVLIIPDRMGVDAFVRDEGRIPENIRLYKELT